MISTIRAPASSNKRLLSACVAKVVPLPGKLKPKASVKQFIEFAVNMPEHDPHVGQALRSYSATSSSLAFSSTAMTIASTKSSFLSANLVFPASIGPPDTKITGILILIAAINMPGVILSQLEIQTIASAQCALTIYSTESAIISREGKLYSMPS